MTILGEVDARPVPYDSLTPFRYDSVSPPVASFLKGQADRIRRFAGKSIVQIGKDLIESKQHLSHGDFIRWVEYEVQLPARTAQAYMRCAQWAEGKGVAAAEFPPSLLYALSSSSTPEDFVERILKKAEAGEHIVLASVKAELRSLRKLNEMAASDRFWCAADGPERPPNATAGGDRKPGNDQEPSNKDRSVVSAVSILLQSLSPQDFAKVKNILTARHVLTDPDLGKRIEAAFRAVDGASDDAV